MNKQIVSTLATAALLVASAAAQEGGGPDASAITDAITDASTVAGTIGAAGLGLLGVFIVFKLIRRAARSLV